MSVMLISVSQDTVVSNKHEERTRHYYVIFQQEKLCDKMIKGGNNLNMLQTTAYTSCIMRQCPSFGTQLLALYAIQPSHDRIVDLVGPPCRSVAKVGSRSSVHSSKTSTTTGLYGSILQYQRYCTITNACIPTPDRTWRLFLHLSLIGTSSLHQPRSNHPQKGPCTT